MTWKLIRCTVSTKYDNVKFMLDEGLGYYETMIVMFPINIVPLKAQNVFSHYKKC